MAVAARRLAFPALVAAALLVRCGKGIAAAPPHPVVVIGVDGGEWLVVRELWAQNKLPALRQIAARGTTASLKTDYGISPVIWTTIATGRPPRVHGITDFVVATPQGDVPVSSTLRQVPALWNMASRAGRKVAVVSWWASWPAETVPGGIVVSDRAMQALPGGVSPPAFAVRFSALRREALGDPRVNRFGGNPETAIRDRVTAEIARVLAAERRHDLLMAYFRGVDLASHLTWRYFHPARFPPVPPAMREEAVAAAAEIPRVYEATDEAIGRIAAAMPNANMFVVSDHGFRRMHEERVLVTIDFDRVLQRIGYLARQPGDRGIDWRHTRVTTWASPPSSPTKRLRFALAGRDRGGVLPAELPGLRTALGRDLARLTWSDGTQAFRLREPRAHERKHGADLVATVLASQGASELRVDGRPWPGAVLAISRISGNHDARTDGFFFAVGPDIARGAAARGISIHDITPTVLYALGLPVGEDFTGTARRDLFTSAFQRQHPLRKIRTWGEPRRGTVTPSAADAELVRELEALGYLR